MPDAYLQIDKIDMIDKVDIYIDRINNKGKCVKTTIKLELLHCNVVAGHPAILNYKLLNLKKQNALLGTKVGQAKEDEPEFLIHNTKPAGDLVLLESIATIQLLHWNGQMQNVSRFIVM